MLFSYIPIFIFMLLVVGFVAGTIVLSAFLGNKIKTKEKLMPYECGIDPIGTPRKRFSIKFYVITLLFLVFDIEVVFLYPWAVIFKELKIFGLIEMGVFIFILFVAYIYVWKKGALEWE